MIEHEKQRIAIDAAEWAYDKINVSAYSGYIAGATNEHPKAWSSAIDEVVKLVFEDDGDFKQSESPALVMAKIQALKKL